MREVWNLIDKYVKANARNKRKGYTLKDIPDSIRLAYLHDEVHELRCEPHDLKEMADILAILFHHAQAHGYTYEQLAQTVVAKLEERFELEEDSDTSEAEEDWTS